MDDDRNRFIPLALKINALILISLIVGLGGITFFLTSALISTIDDDSRDNMNKQAEIMHTSIQNFMIPGEAPLAVNFLEDLRTIGKEFHISLYRANGIPAFSDDETLNKVNENLGMQTFIPGSNRMQGQADMPLDEVMSKLGTPPVPRFLIEQRGDHYYYQMYRPLLNLPKCTRCHGSDHTVRGIIDIQKEFTDTRVHQLNVLRESVLFFFLLVLILTLILTGSVRVMIIKPVTGIGEVCRSVTGGDFSARVSFSRSDELGILGDTVNNMVIGLHERFELSKYVSTSTMQSLTSGQRGEDIEMTLFFSDIRGFTSYTESHSPESVVAHLNRILQIQSEIICRFEGDIDKFVGDEVMAVFAGSDGAVRAMDAAVAVVRALNRHRDEIDDLKVGIGLNTGHVIMGKIGSDQRADFTVIGDHVNTAARLCGAAKAGQILLSSTLVAQLPDSAVYHGPYDLRVKGKQETLAVYVAGVKKS